MMNREAAGRRISAATSRMVAGINQAVLSGASDVIFVGQADGSYLSTPFHVRFGHLTSLNGYSSATTSIEIEINGRLASRDLLSLQLDRSGLAWINRQTKPHLNIQANGQTKPQLEQQLASASQLLPMPTVQAVVPAATAAVGRLSHGLAAVIGPAASQLIATCTEQLGLNLGAQRPPAQPLPKAAPSSVVTIIEQRMSTVTVKPTDPGLQNCLRLSWEEMAGLNLGPGANLASFSVTQESTGKVKCSCNIFVWNNWEKIVVSDIDGTITRSDVRGMVLPLVGVDGWAHKGVVQLYNRLNQKGYQILYLTARSVVQAGQTRDYLRSLSQGGEQLPVGPLFLNPGSAVEAFKQEVIQKTPQEMKIACLSSLSSLFGPAYPFCAGFGNKPTDVDAYREVGLPPEKIFIISKETKAEEDGYCSTTFLQLLKTVDAHFPHYS